MNGDRIDALIAALSAALPGRVATGDAVRAAHANTLTWIASEPPDVVVFAGSSDDVAAVVELARRHRVPVIPFGAGTSLEGQVNAPSGGISLDFSRMNRILAVNAADFDAIVEPGVTREQLNQHLRDTGLFFAVDPGAGTATLGGMAATRASGTTSVRYGTMRDNVLALKAVLADGRQIATARRARKSAAGYDLTHLLIGSEGTLGIITELTVKLHPVPEHVLAMVAQFDTVEAAAGAAIAALGLVAGLARIELLDAASIRAVNVASNLALAERPSLFLELHGGPGALAEAKESLAAVVQDHAGALLGTAETEEERRGLWKARHDAFWAIRAAHPGREPLVTDVCVPLSRLAACVMETVADAERAGLAAPIVGHVGDGNFHAIVMFDAGSAEETARVNAFARRLVERALAMEGTCTGEHGIGQGKMAALAAEHGPAVEVMAAIKEALDPDGLLNPGKIVARDSRLMRR